MKLHRPVVAALALFVGLPALGFADADAAFIRRSAIKTGTTNNGNSFRVSAVVSDDTSIASVGAELESDAGDEALALVESDAWLHGAATITALPTADADLTVTLYDTGSAALMSFSGTLGADGSVTLTADNAKYDIDLLAAEVFTAEKGYDVGVDLAGADTYAVAYATITVTEGGAVCLATDEKGNCLKWDTSKEVSTRTEVYWDDIGSVWEADTTLAHEGLIELKVKTYDARGKKLESAKSKLGAPWLDDGEGVGSLATDEDPLTTMALSRPGRLAPRRWDHIALVSKGWTAGDTLPVDAEVELTNGKAITIPVNSYQRQAASQPKIKDNTKGLLIDFRVVVTDSGRPTTFDGLTTDELGLPICSEGFCVVLSDNGDDGFELAVTAYGATAEALADVVDVALTVTDESGDMSEAEMTLEFDDELTAVFANEVTFASDPVGLGLSGKVSLLGAPNRKGKQETLAKGKFYAELARDGDGDLELAGGDKDEVVSSGNAVVSGDAIGLEDGQGGVDAPPVIVYGVMGNGSGTKNATTTTSARPQLL